MKRTFEIDSARRNRNEFPNPANFMLRNKGAYNPYVEDPIVDAYPYFPNPPDPAFVFQVASTPTSVILPATASTRDNQYISSIMENVTTAEFSRITFYDGALRTATVDPAFTGPIVGNVFRIRKDIPTFAGNVVAVTIGGNTITFPIGASPVDNFYNNHYVWISDIAVGTYGEFHRILSYDGATRVATVQGTFQAGTIAGTGFEILVISRDNNFQLKNHNHRTANRAISYEIELLSISIPNSLIYTSYGGRLLDYRYISVEFRSLSNHSTDHSISNISHSHNITFIAMVDDNAIPTTAPFYVLNGNGCKKRTHMDFNSGFLLHIRLPDGSTFETTPDLLSPYAPNPFLQITCVISAEEVCSD